MSIKELKAQAREKLGKGESGRLRKAGLIPAIIYGHNTPVSITVDAREFYNSFKKISETEVITLNLGKETHNVLIKEYQRNYLKGTIDHLDFLEIQKDQVLRAHVPIQLSGNAPGLKEGGILEHSLHTLEVECQAAVLPEFITVDIGSLSLGHAVHVRDLVPAKGVKILNSGDQVIAAITHTRAEAVAAAPAASAAAPAAPASGAAKA